MSAPVFTSFDCIYPGPHLNEEGKIDDRVWFRLPVELNVEDQSLTYLIFPFGAMDDEITEKKISAADIWTG